jgi:hypothetical protein
MNQPPKVFTLQYTTYYREIKHFFPGRQISFPGSDSFGVGLFPQNGKISGGVKPFWIRSGITVELYRANALFL